jgi:hypothetical protein
MFGPFVLLLFLRGSALICRAAHNARVGTPALDSSAGPADPPKERDVTRATPPGRCRLHQTTPSSRQPAAIEFTRVSVTIS